MDKRKYNDSAENKKEQKEEKELENAEEEEEVEKDSSNQNYNEKSNNSKKSKKQHKKKESNSDNNPQQSKDEKCAFSKGTSLEHNNNTNSNTCTNSITGKTKSNNTKLKFYDQQIEYKFDKKINNTNFRTDNKIKAKYTVPKGRHGYIEDYDLQKAEKFLSYKRVDKNYYNKDVVYGMPSNPAAVIKSNEGTKSDNINNNKIEDTKQEYDLNDDNVVQEEELGDKKSQSVVAEVVEEDVKQENTVNNNNDNNDIVEEDQKIIDPKKEKINEQNTYLNKQKNNFKKLRNINKEKRNINFDIYNNDIESPSEIKETNAEKATPEKKEDNTINIKNNKNFDLLFSDSNTSDIYKYREEKLCPNIYNNPNKEHDPNSCDNCEIIYRLSIEENIPLKAIKCMKCNNPLNNKSLAFYLKKYQKKIIENEKKKNKPIYMDDYKNIGNDWIQWTNVNKQKIKEDNVYKMIEGKIPVNEKFKQDFNKTIKNSQFEDVLKRKNHSLYNTLEKSNKYNHSNQNNNIDFYTQDGLNYLIYNEDDIIKTTNKKVSKVQKQLEKDALINDNDNI